MKVLETELAVQDGADEIDMVVAIGSSETIGSNSSKTTFAAVVRAAAGRPVKVILECGLLTDGQKAGGAEIAVKAGAAFVKTSTGFSWFGRGTVHDVTLLHEAVGTRLSVKEHDPVLRAPSRRSCVPPAAVDGGDLELLPSRLLNVHSVSIVILSARYQCHRRGLHATFTSVWAVVHSRP